MKKNKLVIAPFDDIHLIGINTTLVDYKLAYYFNEVLRFNFVRLKEILLDDILPYAFFYYNAGENRNAYNLVALKSGNHLCLKLNPHIDFLLIIRNHLTDERLAQLVKLVRGIKDVTYAYSLDLSKIPAIDVLLEKIEMHERDYLQQMISST
ncbi:MAG: IPExxxVDY family protein [Bacteroidales bacterium]|nr:IPExxxVDY family protein [Bacteroidales bacterium]